MVTVPAAVWRGGPVARALIVGAAVGVFLGVLAWLDSGQVVAGVVVTVVVGGAYGIVMQRRMARFWPGAAALTGDERVAVARAARRGEPVGSPRLGQALAEYGSGMRAAAETARPYRWLIPFVLVVGVVMAVWDAFYGTWGNAVVSAIYLALLLLEVFWWPRRQRQLLANADRAAVG
ncbi:hypothetical protein [Mycobacterium sp. NPDC050041]|uniref:hypothetical protein n=1 Tax=Mycobacterium sp. NPDC050041 TaxID=3364293 RepID=UPI003C2D762E